MKIIAIFDNGGKSLDRFTVITDITADSNSHLYDALLCNRGGEGFSQWGTAWYNPGTHNRNVHLGKLVSFESLDELTQAHIAYRIFGKDE